MAIFQEAKLRQEMGPSISMEEQKLGILPWDLGNFIVTALLF